MADNPWGRVRLGDVLTQVCRATPVDPTIEYSLLGAHWYAKGLYVKEVKSGAKIQASKLYRVKCGDFVYNRLFAWKGSFAIATEDNDGCFVSNEFPCFSVNPDRVDAQFLWHYFSRQSSWNEALGLSYGATPTSRNRLKEKHFLSLEIPLPPLSEQRRIVAKIERLAARVEEAKKLRSETTTKVASLRGAIVEKICFDQKFKMVSFGDVLQSASNGIYKPPEFWGTGIPCVRMYNIDGPEMNTQNIQFLNVTAEEIEKFGCSEGDLIFNRVNSAELVGKTGLVSSEFPKCTYESKNMRLKVDRSKVIPAFAALVLNSNPVKRYYRGELKQQCGMATLNQQHVKSIPFPLPDKSQQEKIMLEFRRFQSKIEQIQPHQSKTATELDAMLPSILDRAFRGEL
ncbi:MAG: restriction endonuclease subunit S [Thermodesulfobacteriota bacterium]